MILRAAGREEGAEEGQECCLPLQVRVRQHRHEAQGDQGRPHQALRVGQVQYEKI